MYNREAFEEAVDRSGLKERYIAERLGIKYETYIQKKRGSIKWKIDEVYFFCRLLKLSNRERDAIFFAKEVPITGTQHRKAEVTE